MAAKEKLLSLLTKGNRYKFREIMDFVGASKSEASDLLEELREENYKIVFNKLDHTYFLSRIPTPYSDSFPLGFLPMKGKIGLISDTHLCSNADRVDLCEKVYSFFQRHKVRVVIHAGDIMDGWEVYKNHHQFVKVAGCQNQAKYCIQNYPSRPGMRTYFIGGNHDIRSFEKLGVDQCSLVVSGFMQNNHYVKGRKDMTYLGQYSRYLNFPDEVTVHVLHPRGGNAYAKSYPQQKRAREMKSETRPDIQISGHMHTFNWLREDYTQMVALPGMQDETEFFVREGYGRQMGCCLLEYTIKNKHISSMSVRYEVLE